MTVFSVRENEPFFTCSDTGCGTITGDWEKPDTIKRSERKKQAILCMGNFF
jgi:hypothetical protein